jgi:hypothetical protein
VCSAIARDIAALKPKHPQLAEFDAARISVQAGVCIITYAFRTHQATRPGGWTAQVPNPDPDGLWFHVGLWDPNGQERYSQINTQPGSGSFTFGDNNATVLILDGKRAGAFPTELVSLLRRHGMGGPR